MYAYFPKKRHVMIISFFGHSSYVYTIEDENRLLKMIEEVANGQSVIFILADMAILMFLQNIVLININKSISVQNLCFLRLI